MSRFASLALLASLGIVWVWPAIATVLEATQAVALSQRGLTARGLEGIANRLDDWPGSRSVIQAQGNAGGDLLDPASASLVATRGSVARPVRLGLETVGLVLLTELLCVPIGVALAWLLFRTDVPGSRFLLGVIVLSAFVPLPLHATAWLGAFGNVGRLQALGSSPVLVGRFGAAVIHAFAALPWVVLLAGVGLLGVETELEETARLDRAGWWVVIHVTLRRSLGGLAAAALTVAVLTAGDMTVTDLLQIRTYAEEAYLQSILGEGPASASAVAIPPLVVLGPLIVSMAGTLGRIEPERLMSARGFASRQHLNRWRRPVAIGLVLVVGTVVGLPLYGLLWRAGRVGGRATLGQPPTWSLHGLVGTLRESLDDSWEPLVTSLILSAIAATFATVLAWSLTWKSRRSQSWQAALLLTVAVCLAAPGPVAGMALKIAYRMSPAIFDSSAIVVLGMLARILPYACLIVWPAVRVIPPEALEIASVSGYGAIGQLRRVALPFTMTAGRTAWAAAFALALGELSATNLLLPPGITTISMRVWTLLHTGVESHLAGVTLIMLGVVACSGFAVLLAARPREY